MRTVKWRDRFGGGQVGYVGAVKVFTLVPSLTGQGYMLHTTLPGLTDRQALTKVPDEKTGTDLAQDLWGLFEEKIG